jgi:hypothetical protein
MIVKVRDEIREEIGRRDAGCVLGRLLGRCFGPSTPHHLRKSGQGGRYTPANLVVLCAYHNGWVEDEPDRAHQLGLVLRNGDDPDEAARRRRAVL